MKNKNKDEKRYFFENLLNIIAKDSSISTEENESILSEIERIWKIKFEYYHLYKWKRLMKLWIYVLTDPTYFELFPEYQKKIKDFSFLKDFFVLCWKDLNTCELKEYLIERACSDLNIVNRGMRSDFKDIVWVISRTGGITEIGVTVFKK